MEAPAGYKIIRHFDYHGPFTLAQAKNERDRRIVTLKFPNNPNSSNALDYLEDEFEVCSAIERGPILSAQRLIRDVHHPALVLDDMPGQTLHSMCSQPSDLARFLTLAVSAAQMLSLLHESGYLHLNLTPSNILVTKTLDAVRFTGLGDAESIKQKQHPKKRLRDYYELHYLAPEQTDQLDQTPDVRSDIYALGTCLYHFLMAEPPFHAADELGLIHAHMAKTCMPPHEMRTLPRTISDIVMKCLNKNTEERYQTAHSLLADLSRCLRLWRDTKTIEPFELAKEQDHQNFRISPRVYGRESENKSLLGALQQTRHEKKQLVCISGHPGIGKTTLVHQLQTYAVEHGAYFTSGKHDQIRQSTPYAAIIQALKSLTQQILTESDDSIAHWKSSLHNALGDNLGLITEVVPELISITGAPPPIAPMPAAQSQHRFRLVFLQFFEVFAKKEHPLVVFLDDVQWIDGSSLTLINQIANSATPMALMVIFSFRDTEVGQNHPLLSALSDIDPQRTFVTKIHLDPLTESALNALLSDSFGRTESDCLELTQILHKKTNGNPFFVAQFLHKLFDDELIHFDRAQQHWEWALDRIKTQEVSANVVELVREMLASLPEETQRVIAYAAFLGNTFYPETLAAALNLDLMVVNSAIDHAIGRQLIFQVKERQLLEEKLFYKFSHDRIQQAACQYINSNNIGQVHLEIGRNLMANLSEEDYEENLFLIVAQYQLGAGLVQAPDERFKLAQLFNEAGARAKQAAAFDSAKVYLQNAERMLDSARWTDEYTFCFQLYIALAEACYMSGDFNIAQHHFDTLLERAKTNEDRAQAYSLLILFYIHQGKPDLALKAGRECLELFGIRLPADRAEAEELLFQEIDDIHVNMGHKAPEDLILLPELTDATQMPALKLLVSLYASTYQTNILVHCLIGALITNISIKHGNSPFSALGYLTYGSMLCSRFGDIRTGFAFGKLALSMAEKRVANTSTAPIKYSFASFISAWMRPLKEASELLYSAYRESHQAVDLIFAAMSISFLFRVLILKGDPIDQTLEEWRRFVDPVESLKYREILDAFNISGQFLLALKGETESPASMNTESFSEDRLARSLEQSIAKSGSHWYHHCKSMLAYYHGDYHAALVESEQAKLLEEAAFGQAAVAEQHYFMGLILTALYRTASRELQQKYLLQIDAIIEKLKNWAHHSPENFLHKYLLIAAEKAQILGRRHMATELYTQAIKAAKEVDFIHNAAIANELTGQGYFQQGLESMAKAYILEAHQLYSRWGARTKVVQLEKQYSQIFGATSTSHGAKLTTTATHDIQNSLDMSALMKASQAIASEIVMEKLLVQLISVLMEAAGAEKGFIILDSDGDWLIQAEAFTKRDHVLVLQQERFDRSAELSTAVVNYVIRTQEPVHIGNAEEDQLFSSDPFMQSHKVKSVYCQPIIKQSNLIGVVYLENDLVSNAFTPKRQTTLEFLTAQAAVALENAMLYENLKAEISERDRAEKQVRQLNEELELRVTQRTEQLEAANQELESFSYSVSHDLRSPLRTIKGFTEALEEDYGNQLDDAAKDYMNRIQNAADNMEDLIVGMLGLSRAARSELIYEEINLSAMVEDICERQMEQNDVSSVDFTIEPDLKAFGSYGLMRSVMENLIENAIKFSAHQNPAQIEFGSFEQQGETVYYLQDNGVGFSMDYAEKLFGAFQRLHSEVEFEGTGIGLATVQRIIHRHGGRIWARSKEHDGACFYFTLPENEDQ